MDTLGEWAFKFAVHAKLLRRCGWSEPAIVSLGWSVLAGAGLCVDGELELRHETVRMFVKCVREYSDGWRSSHTGRAEEDAGDATHALNDGAPPRKRAPVLGPIPRNMPALQCVGAYDCQLPPAPRRVEMLGVSQVHYYHLLVL